MRANDIVRCRFIGNGKSWAGGGAFFEGISATLRDCQFLYNTAARLGGGIRVGVGLAGGKITLVNSVVAFNTSNYSGSGIYTASGVELWNSTVVYNEGSSGVAGGFVRAYNTIFWGHEEGSDIGSKYIAYNCNLFWGSIEFPNISAEPLFVDAESGDFRLRPDSPCIDAGTRVVTDSHVVNMVPEADLAGNARLMGSEVDIGAYEYRPPQDVNGDGRCNAVDLQLVVNGALVNKGELDCDVNGDGVVNASDVQAIVNAVLGVGR